MTAIARLPVHATTGGRTGVVGLVLDQVGHGVRELWRSRLVLIFTFVLPLTWLVLIGILAGNDAVDPATGVRVMQFVTPTAAVMGVLFAAYPPVANSLAQAREQKITKRLRGTPLPAWAYLVGRVGAAVILAATAVAVMLAVGVLAYGVQIQWQTALATLVTLLLGIGCLAALGLAVGALAPSASVAESFAVASGVVLSFVSGLFVVGVTQPDWMDAVGSIFPVRHLFHPLQDQFNPYATGSGWDVAALVALTAWGIAALLVASWALRREPATSSAPVTARQVETPRQGLRAAAPGRPSWLALVLDQTGWANSTARRDVGQIFFAVAMPVGLYALMCSMYADISVRPAGVPFVLYFACGMAAYGAGVTAFVNLPSRVARARDRGILKRLRGTPLASWHYLAGRTASALWVAVLTALLVFVVGIAFFHVELAAGGAIVALGVLVLGTLSLAACGYALVAVAPSGQATGVIALAILLPLAFISDVFVIGDTPGWMVALASVFPLRHFVRALAAALDPAGASVPWIDMAVMAAWLVAGALIALRRFRWEAKV